jgi:hypothetical protein
VDPVEVAKSTSLFAGVRVAPEDPQTAFLRVSHYREHQVFEAEEGSVVVPGHHVRFSIWSGDEVKSVISITESEARELLRFLNEKLIPELDDDPET